MIFLLDSHAGSTLVDNRNGAHQVALIVNVGGCECMKSEPAVPEQIPSLGRRDNEGVEALVGDDRTNGMKSGATVRPDTR